MSILGIDVGTTSVKIVLKKLSNNQIIQSIIKDTNSTIQLENPLFHEQNVEKIFDTITSILNDFDQDHLQTVCRIGISGQMHGVMFWNNEKDNLSGLFKHSNFITWMDQRCNNDNFIHSLPKMPSNLVDELFVSSGYGCATIFYLNHYEKSFLDQWMYAGNIVDFVICQICDTACPIMSSQMAHGWGYFDLLHNQWFSETLKQNNFPIRLLPEVVNAGTLFAKSKLFLKGVPENALVYVGMGDLQCSMYYALNANLNSAINMSTSCQFVIRVGLEDLKQINFDNKGIINLPPGLVINPFFDRDYLLVAASLNGGNVLANFVMMLQEWMYGLSGINISKEKIWSRLLSTYENKEVVERNSCSTLIINPIIFGERHLPNSGGAVSNVFPYNCKLGDVYKSLCNGLVTNLTSLLPTQMIEKFNVKQLTCSGGVISRHKCVEDVIKEIYGPVISKINFLHDYDACTGVVDFLSQMQ